MKLYQVQLETPSGGIYAFEVFTDDFDAVDIARQYLRHIGVQEWEEACCGCHDCIGGTLDEVEKGVHAFRREEPGKATGNSFELEPEAQPLVRSELEKMMIQDIVAEETANIDRAFCALRESHEQKALEEHIALPTTYFLLEEP